MAEGAPKTHFQCIVVGAGVAGSSAAIRLAQQGIDVLLVERADEPGAKNLSGGILWGDDLSAILPDWKSEAPLERPVTNKKVGFLGTGNAFVVDYHDESLKEETIGYAVLRARLDKWLADEARKAGATVVTGVNVEGLLKQNGVVRGVFQGDEATTADIVIVADGANSRLSLQADLRHGQKKLDADHYALGVKAILKMDKQQMEDRFGCGPDGGTAGEFVLGRGDGVMAGGFIYTNKDTVSLGVVINLPSMKGQGSLTTHDVIEDFRLHPYIQKLVGGAEMVEYGAHLVPEGGYAALGELYGDGVLMVGDAAGFCFSNGVVIQGMNYAARSGILAADTVVHALKKGDTSQVTLKHYEHLLEKSGIMNDFKRFRNVGKFLWNPRMFQKYPDFLARIFRNMLTVGGEKKKMKQQLFDAMKESGVTKRELAADGLNAAVNF